MVPMVTERLTGPAWGPSPLNDVGVNVGQVWPLVVKRGVFTLAE